MKFFAVIKKSMSEMLEFPEDFRKIYVCPMCGYIVKDETPDVCPLCNAPGGASGGFKTIPSCLSGEAVKFHFYKTNQPLNLPQKPALEFRPFDSPRYVLFQLENF